jgi:hypothetical protein
MIIMCVRNAFIRNITYRSVQHDWSVTKYSCDTVPSFIERFTTDIGRKYLLKMAYSYTLDQPSYFESICKYLKNWLRIKQPE